MQTDPTPTAISRIRRLLRGLNEFVGAMEMRPVDYLELRVARLERRIAEMDSSAEMPGVMTDLQRQPTEQ